VPLQIEKEELSSHYVLLLLNNGNLSMKVGVGTENQIQF